MSTAQAEVPLDHLDYAYISKCKDVKELEKIIKILRSGKEGRYPELEQFAEDHLVQLNPKSRLLIKEQPIPSTWSLPKEERNDIFEDLKDWSEDIKSQERGLKDKIINSDIGAGDNLPPVRGASSISVNSDSKSKPEQKPRNNQRRDWKDWDKVNIDAELAKVDDDNSAQPKFEKSRNILRSQPNIRDSISTAGLTDDEKNIKSEREKEKGNEAFRAGDYSEAVLYYSRSLSLNSNVAARNNRAQAYLKLEKWTKAITDVEAVLKVEPDNVKAYLRRGVALKGLKQFVEAKTDLEKVLEIEPNNKRAQVVLDEVQKSLAEQKVKGRRMLIEETDGSSDEEEQNSKDIKEVENTTLEEPHKKLIEETSFDRKEDNKDKAVTDTNKVIEQTKSEADKQSKTPEMSSHSNFKSQSSQKKDTDAVQKQSDNGNKMQQNRSEENKENLQEIKGKEGVSEANVVQEPPPPLPAAVVKLKDCGNEFFKTGRYDEAVTKYTNAINKIESDSRHAVSVSVLFSNRAACKHKIGDCNGCIEDCNRALVLNPGAVKPLLRRATAYETLEKFRHAYVDYQQIVLTERNAEIAQQGASRCQRILQDNYGAKWRDKLPAMSPMAPKTNLPIAASLHSPVTADKPVQALTDEQKTSQYNQEKEKGNEFVKRGKFKFAVDCYTRCIEINPELAVAYTNRALCYLRLDQAEKVLADCDKVFTIEPGNVKAMFRKAQAQKMLKQYKESEESLKLLLALEKDNSAAKRELQVVQRYLQEEEKIKKQIEMTQKEEKTKRKNIKIQEVSDSESEDEKQSHDSVSNATDSTTPHTSSVQEQSQTSVKKQKKKKKKLTKSSPLPRKEATSDGIQGGTKLEKASGFEFLTAWSGLKHSNNIDQYLNVLKQVQPNNLSTVISNKLDGNMLNHIVKCADKLCANGEYGLGYQYLQNLAKVPRFEMNTMFMSKEEKQELSKVMVTLQQAGDATYTTADLDRLKKLYSL